MISRLAKLLGRVQRRSRYELAKRIMPSTSVLGPKVVLPVQGPLIDLRDTRLNLGCGPMHLDGYINIDADPTACADFYMDFGRVGEAFARESVAEVLMVHSIAYLNLWQARDLFVALHGLIRPGGRLVIETPDIERCARKLLESADRWDDYIEGVRGVYAFDPSQVANKSSITPYAFGWSPWHLEKELRAAKFSDVHLVAPEFHGQPWRDLRVEAIK